MTRKEYNKQYMGKNREKILAQKKRHYKKHKESLLAKSKELRIKYLKSWEGYIQTVTKCEMCGKTIYFNRKKKVDAIHFDHRHGLIKGFNITPFAWLAGRPRTTKNEKMWESFDFGKLCGRCNSYLPTENRKEFLEDAINYIKKLEV